MSLFSFGGSKSRTTQRSESYSQDSSQAGSVSGGYSTSGSQSQDSVAFEDLFAKLFGGAGDAAFGLDTSTLTTQANQLFGSGASFLQGLQGTPEQEYLEGRITGENPLLQQNIDALGEDIGKFFSEQINPEITSQAVAGGTLGGGRQGVAQGLAAEAAGKEFQRGALGLRTADMAQRDAAATNLGGLRSQAAGTGLSALPGLAGLAEFAATSPLAPFMALADIMGGPTVLGQSSSESEAGDFATSFSESFGYSRANSSTDSTSKSIKLGFGS